MSGQLGWGPARRAGVLGRWPEGLGRGRAVALPSQGVNRRARRRPLREAHLIRGAIDADQIRAALPRDSYIFPMAHSAPPIPPRQTTGTLDYYKTHLNSVGWFIAPYVTNEFFSRLCREITSAKASFTQVRLQSFLAVVYSPANLAPMVAERYPATPFVNDYRAMISEAVEAHFLGMDHVAIAGLLPVVEGAARKLAAARNIFVDPVKDLFRALADDCKGDAIAGKAGAAGEVISMMDSFIEYTHDQLYIRSDRYALDDKTNRHGILHGQFSDADYGAPLNFYKAIAAVDFLCFISAIRGGGSYFAPVRTTASERLVAHYAACELHRRTRP